MSTNALVHLPPGGAINPAAHFDGPWQRIERAQLATGETRSFQQVGREVALYVIRGTGTMTVSGHAFEIREGSAITMLNNSDVAITTDAGPLDLLLTTVEVTLRES